MKIKKKVPMSPLLNQILQIHDCLDIICNVEKDIFDGSFKGLFRKKDYSGNDGQLKTAMTKLIEIHDTIKNSHFPKQGISMVAEDAKNYAYALTLSTMQLNVINQSLSAKTNGMPYPMSQYNSDCKLLKELQQSYMSLGAKLNADYKLYASEIAQL